MDPTTLTFAFLITPPGILVAAGFTTTFVQIIKGTFPTIDARISGLMLAFFFDAILYATAALALVGNGTIVTADGILWIFAAWLACVAGASGIKAGFTHVVDAPAKGLSLTDPVIESPPPLDPGTMA